MTEQTPDAPRPAEPEPPKAEQEVEDARPCKCGHAFSLHAIIEDREGFKVPYGACSGRGTMPGSTCACKSAVLDYERVIREDERRKMSQPKADTGTLADDCDFFAESFERKAPQTGHDKGTAAVLRKAASALRDALTELRRLRAEVVVTKHARVLSLLGRSSEQEAREEGLREKLAEAEIRAEQAEARAASPDLRALVEKIIAEMRNDAGHYGGRDGMILRGFVKKLEASLTGTGEQK